MTKRRMAAWLQEPLWIPDIRASRAAALTVPAGVPYREAIYDKLVALLEKAGKKAAKGAVQCYLERNEAQILSLDFPFGWADGILSTSDIDELVMMGHPVGVNAAPADVVEEVMEELHDLTLEAFLAAAPGTSRLD